MYTLQHEGFGVQQAPRCVIALRDAPALGQDSPLLCWVGWAEMMLRRGIWMQKSRFELGCFGFDLGRVSLRLL